MMPAACPGGGRVRRGVEDVRLDTIACSYDTTMNGNAVQTTSFTRESRRTPKKSASKARHHSQECNRFHYRARSAPTRPQQNTCACCYPTLTNESFENHCVSRPFLQRLRQDSRGSLRCRGKRWPCTSCIVASAVLAALNVSGVFFLVRQPHRR